MIIGVGCDLVEVARVQKAASNKAFLQKVYTPREIEYCLQRGSHVWESFAARFAAKEAVAKALGSGFRKGALTEIEVINDNVGQPKLQLNGAFLVFAESLGCKNYHISLSHTKDYAMAQVILEGEKR
ncbi:MAG TPA: holo-ACP synthase [Candidatus Avacidaminococcus intestinavium]|uniref:Holo-[acyl-carrier-protein] synthase n=1 Tax=Candidatus Avacidaminococcus intestinavium TaxID=2840684 RepID=A0A9D1MQQ8_9FIRM|nr:holo-ACP synthase [Candidatus Avacidaminococcus intestinavium]